jgi:type IV secretory pathway protease TraF
MSSITLSFHPPTPTPPPSASPVTRRERTWRIAARWIIAICGGVLLLSLARLSFVRGVLRPIRVEGGSMAESLCGDHLLAVCQDCGYRVQCDVNSVPGDGDLLCPNCGYPANPERDAQPVRGERVLVDAFPATLGNLRRWDVVAVSQFGSDAGPIVKRLVALPGEHWEIRQGDLWINGAVQRKSLEQLRSMMVTVNDDRYRPASQQRASRWRATAVNSAWSDEEGRFGYKPTTEAEGQADDWLVYHHQRGLGATAGSELATTVKDLDAYNQAESRTLLPVNDLGAAFRLQIEDARELALAVTGHEGRLTCTLQISKGRVLLAAEGEQLADEPFRWHDWRRTTLVEFGVSDRQFLVGINGREILRTPLGAEPVLPTSEPLAIALKCRQALISRLRVWRDLHYLDPHGRSTEWRPAHALATGQFAVLGDNPPVSIDSRHSAAPIRQEDLWGHVRRPFR